MIKDTKNQDTVGPALKPSGKVPLDSVFDTRSIYYGIATVKPQHLHRSHIVLSKISGGIAKFKI
jgi:hypothetical protein